MPNEESSIVILILLITLLCTYYYFKSVAVERQLTELATIQTAYFYQNNF